MAKVQGDENKKLTDLETNRSDGNDQFLTTNQGLRINDNQNSLKAGERGATLLEDFSRSDLAGGNHWPQFLRMIHDQTFLRR